MDDYSERSKHRGSPRRSKRTAASAASPSLFDPVPERRVEEPPSREAPVLLDSARWGATFAADRDALRLGTNTAKVLALLLDGKLHTLEELRAVGGLQADRRARDLRSAGFGGMTVEVRRDPSNPHNGMWTYRLERPSAAQVRMARRALRAMGSSAHPEAAESGPFTPREWLEQCAAPALRRLEPETAVHVGPVDPMDPVKLRQEEDLPLAAFLRELAVAATASAYIRRDAKGLHVSLVLPYGVEIGYVSIPEQPLALAPIVWP